MLALANTIILITGDTYPHSIVHNSKDNVNDIVLVKSKINQLLVDA